MLRQKNRLMVFISLIVIFSLIPTVFAVDEEVTLLVDETADESPVSIPINDSDILKASNDYYFDASVEKDGVGSQTNPYKYLTADRIKANSNLYLANGEYDLDASKSVQQVNIVGSDAEKTIIKYDGVAFKVGNYLNVKNITFIGSSITNYNQFTAVNCIFEDGYGSQADKYTNNYGGAVFTDKDMTNAYVNVDNCTFKNNYAQYGGAIYMGSGVLDVTNCNFYDNYAYNYGGAIACDYISNVTVKKSKFYNSTAQNDAGGSIYIRQSSKFIGEDITVVNSTATFGGAFTTLNTNVSFNHLEMHNNSAKYDGGAIYHMYGEFSAFNSRFINNSASNGGALFVDNSTNLLLRGDTFTENHAKNAAGAIFSLFNKFTVPFERWNTFNGNSAEYQNNVYYVDSLNLTIGSRNYTMYNIKSNPVTRLPSRYNLVENGYVTAVKDQQTSGNCWAFTAIAVLESCILKASGENLDLSEENMKNVIELYSDYGWKMDTNEGGYDYMPWGYLTSWLGPVGEMDDMFDDKSTLSPVINSIMHVQNIKFLNRDSYTQNDEIKRAILQYGAVGTSIYYDADYFNSLTDAYFNWVNSGGNHAVTIVGWDDTYSKSNFKWQSSIDGDGAWIVKNSWGPDWGNNGYFYVSYYDASFARPSQDNCAYTIILNDTIKFDKNYQYDIAGMTDFFLNSSSKVWYKNKFTSTSDEYLAAVSTYFQRISDWTASVYVNGDLKDVLAGRTDPGYYTFNLNKLISLTAGDIIEVVFNITTADDVVGFPISEAQSLNKLIYSPGISYVSWDGEIWKDLYDFPWTFATHTYKSQVACIKAFTITSLVNTKTDLSIEFNENQPLNITATVKDEYGNPLKYGNVTFTINGLNKIADVKNGIANLLYDFDTKTVTVSATFNGQGYNTSSDLSFFSIPKIPTVLKLEIEQEMNNVNVTVKADRQLNENIIVAVNGKESLLEMINGTATLSLKNLSNDFYQIYALLLDDSDYIAEAVNGEITVDLLKTHLLSNNLTANDDGNFIYNITLLDENGSPVSGREVIFSVNNSTYKNTTDLNGGAAVSLSLAKGVYDVDIAFKGDNSYFNTDAKNRINVKGKVLINLEVNSINNIALINLYASNRINETFTILVNNKPQTVITKDGVASLKLYDLSDGDYNVSALLDENEYEFNNVCEQFTINYGKSANITTGIDYVGDDAVISISVENATGYVNVIVDGVHDLVLLNKSKASYTVKNIAPGNHSVVVIYNGDDFKESFKSEVFNVARKESEIDLNVDSAKAGSISTITVDIAPEATGLVILNVNGSEHMINLSNTNKLSLVLNKSGEYSIVAEYLGDEKYAPSKSKEYVFNVPDKSSANAEIEIPDVIEVGDNVEFKISSATYDALKVYIDGELQLISNQKVLFNALKAGSHTIRMILDENEDYLGFDETIQFDVVKKDANIFIDMLQNVFVGETITVNPVTESDGKLNITVNGQVIDSSYVIPFKGTFVIVVESEETGMYKKASNTTTFTAQKKSADISLNAIVSKAGEKSKIIVNITKEATGIVAVKINDTEYCINLTSGNELEVILGAGNYEIGATYLGDEKYQSAKSEIGHVSVVEKLPANVNVEIPDDIKAGDTIIINVCKDTTSELTATVNGVVQHIEYDNGVLAISVNDLLKSFINGKIVYNVNSAGIYNITVEAKENEYYLGQKVTKIFEATKKDAKLEIIPIVGAEIGDKITVGIINDTDGQLTVYVNGKNVSGDYEITKSGIYTITAVSDESSMYNPGFAAYTFEVPESDVQKRDSSLTISVPQDLKEGASADVTINIPDGQGNVSVIVDGDKTTVSLVNGKTNVHLDNLKAGSHSIVAIYSGDDTHNGAYNFTGFNVASVEMTPENPKEEITPTINISNPVKAGEATDIGISIPDGEGNVSVIVDGVKTIVPLVDGNANVCLDNLKAGNHSVVVIYLGDKTHAPAYSISSFTVPSEAVAVSRLASQFNITEGTTLNTYAVDFNAGERGQLYEFRLTDSNGNPIADASVQFAYKTVIFNRTTDANGIVSLGVSTQFAGDYLCALSYLGDETHNASFVAFNFHLAKKDIKISAAAKSFKKSAKTKKYTVSLKTSKFASKDGKTYLKKGKKVTLKINGKTYTGKTNAKGQVTFKLNKLNKKGKFTATIKFAGDKTYNAATKNVKITIK